MIMEAIVSICANTIFSFARRKFLQSFGKAVTLQIIYSRVGGNIQKSHQCVFSPDKT